MPIRTTSMPVGSAAARCPSRSRHLLLLRGEPLRLLLVLVGALSLGVASIRGLSRGVVGLRQDWLTFFDRVSYVRTAAELHHAWIPSGTGTPIPFPTLWSLVEFFAFLVSVGHITPDILSRLEVVSCIAISATSFYVLLRYAVRCSVLASLFGSIVYTTGPPLFNKVVAGHVPYALGYATLPAAIALFITGTRARGLQSVAQLSAATLFALVSTNGAQFVVMTPLAFVLVSCFGRSSIRVKRILCAALIAVLVAIFQADTVWDAFLPHRLPDNYLTTISHVFFDDFSAGLPAAIFLRGYSGRYYDDALAASGSSALFELAFALLFALVALAQGSKKRRAVYSATAAYVVGVFLLAGTKSNYLAQSFLWLFGHFEPALLFKELYNFVVLPALGFSVLCAIGFETVSTVPGPTLRDARSGLIALLALGALVAPYSVRTASVIGASLILACAVLVGARRLRALRSAGSVLAALGVCIYAWPIVSDGTWSGQLQAVPPPRRDLEIARSLGQENGWHRTLFLPATEPLAVDGSKFAGLDPFAHEPGFPLGESHPRGLAAAALAQLQFGHAKPAAAMLRVLGVRFVVYRPDMISQLMDLIPSRESFESVWRGEGTSAAFKRLRRSLDATDRGSPDQPLAVDLGRTSIISIDDAWGIMPMDLNAIGFINDFRNSFVFLDADPSASIPLPRYRSALLTPPRHAGIPIASQPLGLDPRRDWTPTPARWYESPVLSGLGGAFTESGRPLIIRFTVSRAGIYRPWIAALKWPLGGVLDISIDGGRKASVDCNGTLPRVIGFTTAPTNLSKGTHVLTIRPRFGRSESDVVVALALSKPTGEPTEVESLDFEDRTILRSPERWQRRLSVSDWTYQRLEGFPGSTHSVTKSHVTAEREWFLLHHILGPVKPGPYVFTVRAVNRLGPPLMVSLVDISRPGFPPLGARLMPAGDSTIRLPFVVPPKAGTVLAFLYADARQGAFEASIKSVTLSAIRLSRARHQASLRDRSRRTACEVPNAAFINCRAVLNGPRLVELRESFADGWTLCVRRSRSACAPVDRLNHYKGNGFDNVWYVNAHGPVELEFRYAPDKAFTVLYKLQLLPLVVVCAILLSTGALLLTRCVGDLRKGSHSMN
jgi:hypothetical protein